MEKLHVLPSERGGSSTSGAVTHLGSYNWSGYGDGQPTSGSITYSSVSAQWNQPALKCTSEDRIAVFWSGLDGLTSSTVEQDGTFAQCFEGTAFYYTWWEMYPSNNIQLVGSTVKPGDHITAAVAFSGTSTYTLTVTDATTTGNDINTAQSCSATTCTRTSAEVIAERPSSNFGIYPLAQFGTWSVTNVVVSPNGFAHNPENEIQMIDITQSYVLAQPSSYKAATNSFTDKWKNSY